ncbi:hypothetical protein [Inconstantimicrobium mannanitabidum]|uniref:Uncharacterized protein n=1 Tax=Inconstantimicrobium mannanitabidum TaxID=1604901 RepID=A0ACB5RCN1_9CLOT|nr:hypothetical protein [Clostridium sp. TW13]GKX67019.1 hypothetical protein rsdtw13_22770 [Clostridium sp. TW13]
MKLKKILIFLTLCMTIVLCSCNSNKPATIFKAPDKIIVYKDGKDYTIDKNDKDFNKIVELTNKRIDTKKFSPVKDIISDQTINYLKKDSLSLEFIYNEEHVYYNKLFFLIKSKDSGDDDTSATHFYQYGNSKDSYDIKNNSSVGPIGSPEEIVKLIDSKNLK